MQLANDMGIKKLLNLEVEKFLLVLQRMLKNVSETECYENPEF